MRSVEPSCRVALHIGAALCLTGVPALSFAAPATSQTDSEAGLQLEEVVVSSRKLEERLQDVPDAITAFTAATITNAGMDHFEDFAARVPNLNFRDNSTFRGGQLFFTMRGIGNSQEGYPPVSYIVDGVPRDTTDSIDTGSLQNLERVEVLRGPQSALYGFNAIAGAINIITRRPENDWGFEARALYGNGNDRRIGGTASGAIIPDKLLASVGVSYRDDDGLFQSASNGIDLAFMREKQAHARLLITPAERLEIDLQGSFTKQNNGSVYQAKLPNPTYIDDFDSGLDARRGFPGEQDRELYHLDSRIRLDFDKFSLISVTGYGHINQSIVSSLCYDDPDDPAVPNAAGAAQCLFGPAFGSNAAPGTAIDDLYLSADNFRTTTQDLRLASRDDGALQWTVGASYLHRSAIEGFDGGPILAPDRAFVNRSPTWNGKRDDWWGVYGQVIWKVTSRLELTANARYDDERYENTTYTDRNETTVIQVRAPGSGELIDTQREDAAAFQPKGQVSFHFTDDVMGYASVSRGFRAGFFNTGKFQIPEHTTDYELGTKTTWLDRRVTADAAVFYIDYSDQQFSTVTTTPPFRVANTIPKTRIHGAELETSFLVSRYLSFDVGMGWIDAEVGGGTHPPGVPEFNASVGLDANYPIAGGWKARLHLDDRYNSSQYLGQGDILQVPAKNFLDARLGVENDRYSVMAFTRNAFDVREAQFGGVNFAGGFVRGANAPRSYGVELRATY